MILRRTCTKRYSSFRVQLKRVRATCCPNALGGPSLQNQNCAPDYRYGIHPELFFLFFQNIIFSYNMRCTNFWLVFLLKSIRNVAYLRIIESDKHNSPLPNTRANYPSQTQSHFSICYQVTHVAYICYNSHPTFCTFYILYKGLLSSI